MTISKEQISTAKAIAIIFMFAHHIFAFPERIPTDQNLLSVILVKSIFIEHEIGSFGKVCVGMFMFISGLGLGLTRKKWGIWSLPTRLIPFYSVFIANLIILISVSYFLISKDKTIGDWNGIDYTIKSLLGNIFLLNPNYSMEWWFARLYVAIILLAWPMCELISRTSLIGLGLFSSTLFSVSWLFPSPDRFLFYQLIFTMGFLASRQIKLLSAPPLNQRGKLFLLCISVFVISFLARRLLGVAWEAILAPVCVWAAIWLPIYGPFRRALILIGHNSASMWLNHTFICYYWFNEAFYSIKYTPALLGVLLGLSLLLALVTNPLVIIIRRSIEWAQEKFRRSLAA